MPYLQILTLFSIQYFKKLHLLISSSISCRKLSIRLPSWKQIQVFQNPDFFFFAWKLQFYQVVPAVLLEVRGSLWPFSRKCLHIPASGSPESVSGSPHPTSRTVVVGEHRLTELRTWCPLLLGLQLPDHNRAPGIREQTQDLPYPFHATKTVLGMTLLYGWGF